MLHQRITTWRFQLFYALPAVLFCSYFPVIQLGSTEYMHFEIFLPLIWLVLFDVLALIGFFLNTIPRPTIKLFLLLAFPSYVTLSLFWTKDFIRGFLTCGIIWALIIAILSVRQLVKSAKKSSAIATLKTKLLRTFFISALIASAICWLQCALDVIGFSRNHTLLCAGCTYQVIGFPHPNGLAVEPQYMGNLLLAPALLIIYMKLFDRSIFSRKKTTLIAIFLTATLFLTLSRGAIISFIVAAAVLIIYSRIAKQHTPLLPTLAIVCAAPLIAIFSHGLMAELAPTSDNFYSGVTKSIHQLSLGKIDLRPDPAPTTNSEPLFNGYIEESTTNRLSLNDFALQIIGSSPTNLWFGVGIGGALRAMADFSGIREVIPNVYLTILAETGIIGTILLLATIVTLIIRLKNLHHPATIYLIALLIAYGISINFFSGLTNVIHIYLLPAIIFIFLSITSNKQFFPKKS